MPEYISTHLIDIKWKRYEFNNSRYMHIDWEINIKIEFSVYISVILFRKQCIYIFIKSIAKGYVIYNLISCSCFGKYAIDMKNIYLIRSTYLFFYLRNVKFLISNWLEAVLLLFWEMERDILHNHLFILFIFCDIVSEGRHVENL